MSLRFMQRLGLNQSSVLIKSLRGISRPARSALSFQRKLFFHLYNVCKFQAE